MDAQSILRALREHRPLFTAFPTHLPAPRIIGLESELGVDTNAAGEALITKHNLPAVLENGGELYRDVEHLEYCTPETSNPVSAVAYNEACKRICRDGGYSPRLFCHNRDWYGNSFGTHENYFTSAPRRDWGLLIPFLVARTAIVGAGWFIERGTFELSQRASSITEAFSDDTVQVKSVINKRREALARVRGMDRMHLILGDANMLEAATFMKLSLTSLLLELLEMGALPALSYDAAQAPFDLRSLSLRIDGWRLSGVRSGEKDALMLLSRYVGRIKELFSHRDPVTDATIVLVEDTLDALQNGDEERLVGRLDWVTKRHLLRLFCEAESRVCDPQLRDLDMAYHDLDEDIGLYNGLRQSGLVERIVSDVLITRAMKTPPRDTRAYARGNVATALKRAGGDYKLCAGIWQKLIAIPGPGLRIGPMSPDKLFPGTVLFEEPMADPRIPYRRTLKRIRSRIWRSLPRK